MRELMFVLQFCGKVKPVGVDGNVLAISSSASGCTIGALIGTEGIRATLRTAAGDEATLESEWVFTGATTFQEVGVVQYGRGCHQLRFSTFGSARLGPALADRRRHGAAIRRVDGGEGQFAGATGLIASIFTLDDAGTLTDTQIATLFLTSQAKET